MPGRWQCPPPRRATPRGSDMVAATRRTLGEPPPRARRRAPPAARPGLRPHLRRPRDAPARLGRALRRAGRPALPDRGRRGGADLGRSRRRSRAVAGRLGGGGTKGGRPGALLGRGQRRAGRGARGLSEARAGRRADERRVPGRGRSRTWWATPDRARQSSTTPSGASTFRAADAGVLRLDPRVDLPDGTPPKLDVSPPTAPALIGYTSGTTGRPKGAVLSHANLLASLESLRLAWRWTGDDRLVLALPLFHMHGLGVGLHGTLHVGGSAVLVPRFDPSPSSTRSRRTKPASSSGCRPCTTDSSTPRGSTRSLPCGCASRARHRCPPTCTGASSRSRGSASSSATA